MIVRVDEQDIGTGRSVRFFRQSGVEGSPPIIATLSIRYLTLYLF